MTLKYVDTFEKKWPVALVGTLSGMYLLFIFPFHIILTGLTYSYSKFYGFRQADINLSIFLLLSLLIAITMIFIAIYTQRKNISVFSSYFSQAGTICPLPSSIAKAWSGKSFVGLDTKNGTLLYINHPDTTVFNFFFPRDVRVMGFGMNDWKSVEVQGNTLTIYTGNPELPFVSVTSGKASQLYEKINAMRHQTWTYENNIPGYVEHHAARIAARKGINLILPPN
ncbi:hypothetical protein [Erwinia sp. LJJL01]|uniref:hypothetical protein n=1 Tax=Erwinia sp. LJJL01 TaxID=3391839 RepID=UPI0039AF61DD